MCMSTIPRCILIIFNIIWVIIGLAFLAVGIVVRVAGANYFNAAFAALPGGATMQPVKDFDIESFLQSAFIPLIVIGAVFFLFGFLGCCGACCNSGSLLMIYAILVSIILLVQIAGIIIFFVKRDLIVGAVKEPLTNAIHKNFAGYNATDYLSLFVNFAQFQFGCCGVDSYTVFDGATKWKNKAQQWNGRTTTFAIPVSCCIFPANSKFSLKMQPSDMNCPTNPSTSNSNQNMSCFKRLDDLIEANKWWVVLVLSCICALQLVFIILALCLRKTIDSDKLL
ncbi:tetraspanin-6-like [Tubulanus polymorphus]|uniref:tetraspanin-6-like n=1 Tax=Tubulanus polymorphus TaxID=672921 RepID=UPI003DA6B2E7